MGSLWAILFVPTDMDCLFSASLTQPIFNLDVGDDILFTSLQEDLSVEAIFVEADVEYVRWMFSQNICFMDCSTSCNDKKTLKRLPPLNKSRLGLRHFLVHILGFCCLAWMGSLRALILVPTDIACLCDVYEKPPPVNKSSRGIASACSKSSAPFPTSRVTIPWKKPGKLDDVRFDGWLDKMTSSSPPPGGFRSI
ncbi:hypothetical protein DM860_001807 [Cuscuta australis]|uniref:Uncharacterized protein n=1 Tax=Cuscuta australis TaxID=267555 RepID=A0A328EDL7_9ASTE|nr:hypothetical protein DM860_001807 [Cuscuta australis]